jgi:hypothetical protein
MSPTGYMAAFASILVVSLACHDGRQDAGSPASPDDDGPVLQGESLGAGTPETSGGTCADREHVFPHSDLAPRAGPVPCGGGFCVENALASSRGLPVHSLTTPGEGDLWGLDRDGTILLRRFAGSWTTQCLPPGATRLRTVSAAGPRQVWAGGDGGFVAHWNGTGWTRTVLPTDDTVLAISGDAREAFATTLSGVVLRFDGTAWAESRSLGSSGWGRPTVAAAKGTALVLGEGLLLWSAGRWYALDHAGWHPMAIWVSPEGEGFVGGVTATAFSFERRPVLFRVHGIVLEPVPLPESSAWAAPYKAVSWIGGAEGELWVQLDREHSYYPDLVRRGDHGWHVAVPQTVPTEARVVLGSSSALIGLLGLGLGYGGGIQAFETARLYRWTEDIDPLGGFPPTELDVGSPRFFRVAAAAPDDVWVLAGEYETEEAAAWHLDGGTWRELRRGGRLTDVATSDPSNTWIVGADEDGAFALAWFGAGFLRHPLPGGGVPEAVATRSPVATWVAMDGAVLRWDGAGWRVIATNVGGFATRLHAVSTSEVWAVSATATAEDGTYRRLGRVIRVADEAVSTLELLDFRPLAVWGSSPKDVWISAIAEPACATQRQCPAPAPAERLLHWNGSEWSEAEPLAFAAIGGTGPTDVWGVTSIFDAEVLYRLDHGEWRAVASVRRPFAPQAMAVLPDGEIWGTGAWGQILHRRPAAFRGRTAR